MADDDRRAEIEAVARASAALDEVVAYFDDGHCLPPAGFPLASVVRPAAESLRTALDRIRDARGDDEALLEATKREAACGRELAAAHARIAELEAARSPQDEDHEALRPLSAENDERHARWEFEQSRLQRESIATTHQDALAAACGTEADGSARPPQDENPMADDERRAEIDFMHDLPVAQNDALKVTKLVLNEIRAERARQFAEWGWQPNNGERDLVGHEHDDSHEPGDWTRFIVRHLGRAEQGIEDGDRYRYREQLLRVAALAVAAIESFDRKDRP